MEARRWFKTYQSNANTKYTNSQIHKYTNTLASWPMLRRRASECGWWGKWWRLRGRVLSQYWVSWSGCTLSTMHTHYLGHLGPTPQKNLWTVDVIFSILWENMMLKTSEEFGDLNLWKEIRFYFKSWWDCLEVATGKLFKLKSPPVVRKGGNTKQIVLQSQTNT